MDETENAEKKKTSRQNVHGPDFDPEKATDIDKHAREKNRNRNPNTWWG